MRPSNPPMASWLLMMYSYTLLVPKIAQQVKQGTL